MKTQLAGSFEFGGIEYDYTAVIYSGDDSYIYPDQITDLDRSDGKPLKAGIWEEVEFAAQLNAYLLEWCEREGWAEEDTGGGCTAFVRTKGGVSERITKANDPSAPQEMGEPVLIGSYDADNQLIGGVRLFKGGINEWIADPAISRWASHSELILEIAGKLGRETINPCWVEAFMSLEYPSLNSISRESFEQEIQVAINCIDFIGPEKSEQIAQSFGL